VYKSARSRLDCYEIPEDVYICEECAEKEITRLKVEQIYGPIFDELAKRANSTLFNSDGTDVKAMLQAFTRQHRHLQGEIFQALMKFIEQIGQLDENQFFDARNEFIRIYAKKASDAWRYL
jgi:hypothetical protein